MDQPSSSMLSKLNISSIAYPISPKKEECKKCL